MFAQPAPPGRVLRLAREHRRQFHISRVGQCQNRPNRVPPVHSVFMLGVALAQRAPYL
jgi:hypothetical protein